MRHIPELDGIRAIAVIPVLFIHAKVSAHIPGLGSGGFLGVDIFFVLSGFLITTLLIAEQASTGRVSLSGFYARRARRILPPLVLAVAMAFFLNKHPFAAFASLGFFANLVDSGELTLLAHTWSLAIEEHFYFTWPLLFALPGRWRAAALAGFVAVAVLSRHIEMSAGDIEDAYRLTWCRADSLAIGCAAALFPAMFQAPRWVSLACMVAVAALLLGAQRVQMAYFGFTAFAAMVAIALVAIVRGQHAQIGRALRLVPMRYIGTRSYGLYLYHYPILRYLIEESPFPTWSISQRAVVGLVLTFALAELSYRTIETYFRKPRTVETRLAAPA